MTIVTFTNFPKIWKSLTNALYFSHIHKFLLSIKIYTGILWFHFDYIATKKQPDRFKPVRLLNHPAEGSD